MRAVEVELWVQRVVERARHGTLAEDARVELKQQVPADDRGLRRWARRIAGHANAAGGEPILWVIGVGDGGELVGLGPEDPSSWWPQVRSYFDHPVAPTLLYDLVVPVGGEAVRALLFDSSRAPYLVRTGTEPPVEVPWREGTSVRTARREDLLRILVPRARLPNVEVLGADVSQDATSGVLSAAMTLYVAPVRSEPVTVAMHRTSLTLRLAGRSLTCPDPRVRPWAGEGAPLATLTNWDAHVRAPSRLVVIGQYAAQPPLTEAELEVSARLFIVEAEAHSPLDFTVSRPTGGVRWVFARERP